MSPPRISFIFSLKVPFFLFVFYVQQLVKLIIYKYCATSEVRTVSVMISCILHK